MKFHPNDTTRIRKCMDRGLVVVGFQSNDSSQKAVTNKEVAEFCRTTYGVDFPQLGQIEEKPTSAMDQAARSPI